MATRTPYFWTDPVATSSGTRPAPTAATEGLSLTGVTKFRVFVSAASGQTLSGAGTLQAYVWEDGLNSGSGGWARNPDQDVTVNASAVQAMASSDLVVGVGTGRVVFRANGVTTSSGEVTVSIRTERT